MTRSWPPTPAQQEKHEYGPEGEGFAGSRPYGARQPSHMLTLLHTTERDERFLLSLQLARGGGRCKLARRLAPRLTMDYYFTALRSKVRSLPSTALTRAKTRIGKELGTRCLPDLVLLLSAV